MESAVDIILFGVLVLVCVGSLFSSVLQLPGTWFIVMAAIAYGWYYGWQRIGWGTVIAAVVIALVAEVVELLGGAVVAKRGGASRRAAWYGLFGGLAGALLLTIPVPLIGTIIGAALGCFAGAFVAELEQGRGLDVGARSGLYSAMGRTLASMLKVFAGLVISSVVIVRAVAGFWGQQ